MKNIGNLIAATVSLLFLLGFFLLGKPILISILYGLIGGLSTYYLTACWQNDEKPEAAQEPDFIPFSKDINKILVKTKIVKPENTTAQRPTQPSSILEWFIKEDKSPPSR